MKVSPNTLVIYGPEIDVPPQIRAVAMAYFTQDFPGWTPDFTKLVFNGAEEKPITYSVAATKPDGTPVVVHGQFAEDGSIDAYEIDG